MTYNETLDYLYNAAPAFEKVGAGAYKEGLQNTFALDEHFGHPHRQYRTIHVAGTNGKGSVSHTLAALLQTAGYKVGLYTSPHLVDFNERIRVNGEPIEHEYVVDFVEREKDFFEPLCPSFFELTTALAFKYFADKNIDIAVIEVGLGGRLDCTNIIEPLLCVITNISFDHTAFLGNTLAKIAGEKAGIIKKGVPVVIGEHDEETRKVFEGRAAALSAPIIFAQDDQYVVSSKPVAGGGRSYETTCFGVLKGTLGGECQEKNVNTILHTLLPLAKAMKKVGMPPLSESMKLRGETLIGMVRKALENVCGMTGLAGRWQTLRQDPLVICDTGHNLAGWQYLSRQIQAVAADRKKACPISRLRIVFGMVDDKDVDAVMALLPTDAVYYFTQADTHRAIPVAALMQLAAEKGLQGQAFPTVKTACQAALEDCAAEDFVFVGGSSYVVADLLSADLTARESKHK